MPEQMRRNAGQFATNHAEILQAGRELVVNAQQLFDGERVGDVVGQRREIIQPVRVRDELGVGHVLGDFLVAAMQVADVRHGPGDDLAVEFQHNAQHAVRGRVRRAHVQDHLLALHVLKGFRRPCRLRGRVFELDVLNVGHVSSAKEFELKRRDAEGAEIR